MRPVRHASEGGRGASEGGSGEDAVPNADGNITNDAGARGDHLIVVQLDLLLADLSFERVQLRLGGVESRARLVKFLLTHYAGIG